MVALKISSLSFGAPAYIKKIDSSTILLVYNSYVSGSYWHLGDNEIYPY